MDTDEFVRRFGHYITSSLYSWQEVWEQSEGVVLVYTLCVHGDENGLDPVAIVEFADLDWTAVMRVIAGCASGLDAAFVLTRATMVDFDSIDDLKVDRRVLELTQPTRRGWMVWHVTLTGVTHHHLSVDGDLRELTPTNHRPETQLVNELLTNILI